MHGIQKIRQFLAVIESGNEVRTQIWAAMAIYALIAIIKKNLAMKLPLYNFL